MQVIGIILILISVLTIATPFAVVTVVYQNDLSQLVITPQIIKIMNETFPSGLEFQLPMFVGAAIDNSSHIMILTVNFTNPVNYDLTLKEVAAQVVCRDHNFTIGYAELIGSLIIPADETVQFYVICNWIETAKTHILIQHADQSNLLVNLQDLSVNFNNIILEVSQTIELPFEVPISTMF